jgi:hypothetical protein
MLHISVHKLVLAAKQDMISRKRAVIGQQADHVLQLIPKAKGSAGLVEARSAQQARGPCLVRQPVIHKQIERLIGRLNLNCPKTCLPQLFHSGQSRLRQKFHNRFIVLRNVICIAKQKMLAHLRVYRQRHRDAEHRARVARTCPIRKSLPFQPIRYPADTTADEFAFIRGIPKQPSHRRA